MKKRIFIFLLAVMLLVLSACGTKTQTESEVVSENESSTVSELESNETSSAEEPEEAEPTDEITSGASMEEAQSLQFNMRYHGKYTEGEIWISFTTGDMEEDPYKVSDGVPYKITLENQTVGSEPLDGYLVDEYGNSVKAAELRNGDNYYGLAVRAKEDGTADTAMFNTLQPNTTYFLRLQGKSKAQYSIRITDPGQDAFDTTEGRTVIGKGEEFIPATNQDAAPLLNSNVRYKGNYADGYQWIAFRTGDIEEDPYKIAECVPYRITLENQTTGSEPLDGYLVDEYGNSVKAAELRNGDNYYGLAVRAKEDGTADTAMFNTLQPNTTYFLRLQGKSKAAYILTINTPEGITESENFVPENDSEIPGTSQSFALNTPLETTVTAKYTGGYSWLAFTTNETENAEYYVTLVNCTVDSEPLGGYLVDEYGNIVKAAELRNGDNYYGLSVRAKQDGRADTAMFNNLKPNTNYYMRVQAKQNADYSFRVSCPSVSRDKAYGTSSSLSESIGTLDSNVSFYTGTNETVATLLKTNTRYHGSYIDGYSWVCFTTGETEDTEYRITLENLTVGSEPLDGYLVDEYGNSVKAAELRNGDNYYGLSVRAKQDGTADTAMFNTLQPNTTYYLFLCGKNKAEYILTIGAPDPEENGNTIESAEIVFEVPFELNETQVRFVGDEAIFIDEEEAKAALAPVAEIILAHPGHQILLAGTTATAGTQEGCVNLSNRRAAAVKDLLVNYFGVPESQLITIGLGYEDDPFVRGRDRDANGNFVETEAAKNRRVVVLDAESEIAQSILGN